MKFNINIDWFDVPEDKKEHLAYQLIEAGLERAKPMILDGYVSGELRTTVDIDGKEVELSGWWEIKEG